ncbi:MAG: hypothetical protein U9Q34_04105 [Elusimicrobiota bacterium]|nr:hypothetical protein [Elusimicrobiota bacterium]
MFICEIVKIFKKNKIKFAIVGGYAVALHGAVRGTVDLDIVLELDKKSFIAVESALKSMGLVSRLPINAEQVFDFRLEYIKNKNLIAWSFWNPENPIELVDIILSYDLKGHKIKHVKSDGVNLPILAIAELIKMKQKSGRVQDMEDIKALESLK